MAAKPSRTPGPTHWAVGTTLMPAFVDDGVQPPFRPILVAVVDSHGLVIGHGVASPDDAKAGVVDALNQAIGKPANGFGRGTTPEEITVTDPGLKAVVAELLPEARIQVGRSPELEEVFQAVPSMADASGPRGIAGVETYLTSDLTPDAVGSFFAACKGLYERQPWHLFADDQCLFTVSCQALGMRRWCGCVIGQEGESYGVLLFESQREQERFFLAAEHAEDIMSLPPDVLPHQRAISFEPLDNLSRPLAAEIEHHQWPVAQGDGYPIPMHIDSEFLNVPNTSVDLARLEVLARTLSRLIDNTPQLEDYWNWTGLAPLRKQFRLPVQGGAPVSVSITLLPREDDEPEWLDLM